MPTEPDRGARRAAGPAAGEGTAACEDAARDDVARDDAAREQALDPSRSISLEAPAGSGKTSILVQRFLGLLATVDEPEQILAITFTRKAAGEMRERVLRALRGEPALGRETGRFASSDPLDAQASAARARSVARGWQLDASPGRLRIQTIDALNRALAARLPIAARGAGELQIAEQPRVLYRAAARRALLDAESDPVLRADAELLFGRLDNDFGRFERLLTEMLQARAHWLPKLLGPAREPGSDLRARVEASLRTIVAERISEAAARIPRELIEEGIRLAHEAACRCAAEGHAKAGPARIWMRDFRADGLTLEHWQGIAQLALTNQGTWRKVLTPREGFATQEKRLREAALDWLARLARVDGARERLVELARLPPPALADDDALALAALSRLLKLAASELELVFRDSGRVDHTAIAGAARQALMEAGAPTDLALWQGSQLRHILVDEFQDTSIEQYQLLEALTATWEEGDGRTLFVVGDPMQSIYQFREAEVGLFLRASKYGLGAVRLEPLALTRNFRSAPELVAWTNRIFPQCFPQIDDTRASAVRYRPCVAGRSDRDAGGLVRWHATAPGDVDAEADAIANLVVRLRAEEASAQIAILLAARSHAPPIVAALQGARIGVAGVDLVALAELPVVRDLQALARALHHLDDRTAWLAVLRGPWCGLSLGELSLLAERPARRTLWEALNDDAIVSRLSADGQARVTRTRAALAPALTRRERLDAASWVESAWLQLGGPAACASDADLDHARTFFAHLARWSAEPGWTGPLALEERLAALYASHETVPGAVHMMTIHRAKGLQFDHVIVPGLGRKLRSSPEPLLRWLELPRGRAGSDLLMAPIPPIGRSATDRLGEYLKSLQSRRAAHERVRLIYVAATRARSQLHLFGEQRAPRPGTLLAALWPAAAGEFRVATAPDAVTAAPGPSAARTRVRTRFERLAVDWHLPVLPAAPPFQWLEVAGGEPSLVGGETAFDPAILLPGHAAARVVSDRLGRYARQGRSPASAREQPGAQSIARALRERLARLGVAGAELDEETRRAFALWERCTADAQLQWIFSSSHTRAGAPFEVSGLHEGRLASVTIDRTFVDHGGVRWLVNFRPGLERLRPDELEMERGLVLARALEADEVRGGLYLAAVQSFREILTS